MMEDNQMICIDANAFYWYYGRDKLPLPTSVPKFDVSKFKSFYDSKQSKSISASAFLEIIVHFRSQPEVIRAILKFREQKRIKIYNNLSEYVFTPDLLQCYHFMDNKALSIYANELLAIKIDIETKFSYAFMQIVSIVYANYCLDSKTTMDGNVKDNILSLLFRGMSTSLQADYCSQLKMALVDGYNDNNKSQQYLKKKYIELLTQKCLITHMIIEAAENAKTEENLIDLMCNVASNMRSNSLNEDNTMKTIMNTLDNNLDFLHFAESQIGNICIKKGYTPHQAKYIEYMLQAWLERGQKLRKNDIFDMICVGVLDKVDFDPSLSVLVDQSTYLITFDDIMVKFIENTNEKSFRMIDQFYSY